MGPWWELSYNDSDVTATLVCFYPVAQEYLYQHQENVSASMLLVAFQDTWLATVGQDGGVDVPKVCLI